MLKKWESGPDVADIGYGRYTSSGERLWRFSSRLTDRNGRNRYVKGAPHDSVRGTRLPGSGLAVWRLSARAYDTLDQETLADLDDLTLRGWCVEQGTRVVALLLHLPERLPVSQMVPSLLSQNSGESFRDLGLYDEVWQCVKPSSAHSVPDVLRRGYVEVLL